MDLQIKLARVFANRQSDMRKLLTLLFTGLCLSGLYGCFGNDSDNCHKAAPPVLPTGAGLIVVSPESIDFGSVVVNPTTIPVVTLTVGNEGDGVLTLHEVVFSEDTDPDFAFLTPPAEGITIDPSGHIQIVVRFAPQEPGPATGAILIRSDDPEQPEVVVSLSGEGIQPPINEIPVGQCTAVRLPAGAAAPKNFVASVGADLVPPGVCTYLTFVVEDPDPQEAAVVLHVRFGQEVVFDPESEVFLEDASGTGVVTIRGAGIRPGLYYVLPENQGETSVSFNLCVYLTAGGVAFRRGYLDADDRLLIDDVIFLLNFLFLDGPEPSCVQAADSNGDCRLTVSDATRLLRYLFDPTGPGAPPPPFAECGCPEVPCDLPCLSFPLCEGLSETASTQQ